MVGRIGRIGAGAKTFGRIFSVALRQAQQSEIDVLSKRSFRDRYEPGEDYSAHLRAAIPRDEKLPARVGGGLRTILGCCSEANRQAMQSEIDVLARRRFRGSHDAGDTIVDVSAPEGEAGDAGERAPHEENRNRSFPLPYQMEGSFPDKL